MTPAKLEPNTSLIFGRGVKIRCATALGSGDSVNSYTAVGISEDNCWIDVLLEGLL